MPNPRTFQIQEISAHPGPVPGFDTRREEPVCKYIDVTTCIGCKACEVACVEWNDHPFRETTFNDTYQTMPSTEWNYYNLIKFAEDEGKTALMTANQLSPAAIDPNAYTPEFKGFLVKIEKA